MELLSKLKIPYIKALQFWLAQVAALSILTVGFSSQLIHSLTYELLLFVIFASSIVPSLIKCFAFMTRVCLELLMYNRLNIEAHGLFRFAIKATLVTAIDIYNCFIVLITFMVTLSIFLAFTLPNMTLSNSIVIPTMVIGIVIGYQIVKLQYYVGSKMYLLIAHRLFRKN